MSEQNGSKRNVVIVMYQYSVIVKTIERKLQELRYEVEILAGEFDKIAEKAMVKPLFLVYLPKNFVSDIRNISSLNLILDIISKKGAEMILLGEGSDYADVMMQVPLASDYEWISRPLKMDEFTLSVMKHTRNKSKRILIVDDDPAYAKMLRECLKDEYSTFILTDGSQVIKALRQTLVDLILLDYEMPVMDGPQVFQMLKGDEVLKNIPVVFLTGVSGKEQVARVVALKPRGYILKSNKKEKLLEYIKGIL
jgi:CheY-like chemotaxis protein